MTHTTGFPATIMISPRLVADQITAAVEGGSTYWCDKLLLIRPDRSTLGRKPWYDDEVLYAQEFSIEVTAQEDEKVYHLNREAIGAGLTWLSSNHPDRVKEIVEETGDAETADVFLQACIFGAIVYG